MPSLFPLRPPSHRHSLLFLLLSLLLLFFLILLSSFRHSPLFPPDIPSLYSQNAPHRLFLSLSAGANATISAHLRTLTLRPHLAGTPSAAPVAAYVLAHFQAAGLETHFVDYYPLLSYPVSASLSLHRADGALLRVFSLAEPADPAGDAVLPYHAYSPSGAVYAPAVYVNFGREEDYRALERMGVEVKGFVVIARRGGEYRGAVVARAAEKGAAAVLMFKEADGGGVERGTVLLGGVGDPLTPGWAATGEAERLGLQEEEARQRFPKIPSMPVAESAATEILRTLGGFRVPHEWRGQLPLEEKGGVGPGPLLVNFTYQVQW